MIHWRNILLLLGLWLGMTSPAFAGSGPEMTAVQGDLVAAPGRGADVPPGWETVYGYHVAVHGPAKHEGLMRSLVDHADTSVPVLAERLMMPIGPPIDIFLSSTDAQFRQVQPGVPPAWADATAYPALGAVYLRAPAARRGTESLEQVLDHELVHIVVGRAFAPERPPTWLQEGLAQFHAEQHDFEDLRTLAGAAMFGPIPLDELERAFPENPHAAGLAYAESVDFLVWMEAQYGRKSVPTLVAAMRDGHSLADAVRMATGEPLYRIDAEWQDRFSFTSPIAWTALASSDWIWLLSALLGLVAMFVVRRRQRLRRNEIKAQEVEEEALMQAIWEGRFPQRDRPSAVSLR
ncbi:MAG: hypothetical protein AB8H79_00590 [Myxococcota bacterium]